MMSAQKVIEEYLNDLGIGSYRRLAGIVYEQQRDYIVGLTQNDCLQAVLDVMANREMQHAMLVAIELDSIAQEAANHEGGVARQANPLIRLLVDDNSNFGVDEHIAMSVAGLYGSIATSNFGYLDKVKPGVIGEINDMGKNGTRVTTMIDDMLCAVVASAEATLTD